MLCYKTKKFKNPLSNNIYYNVRTLLKKRCINHFNDNSQKIISEKILYYIIFIFKNFIYLKGKIFF